MSVVVDCYYAYSSCFVFRRVVAAGIAVLLESLVVGSGKTSSLQRIKSPWSQHATKCSLLLHTVKLTVGYMTQDTTHPLQHKLWRWCLYSRCLICLVGNFPRRFDCGIVFVAE